MLMGLLQRLRLRSTISSMIDAIDWFPAIPPGISRELPGFLVVFISALLWFLLVSWGCCLILGVVGALLIDYI